MKKELKPCPFCGGEAKVYEMKYGGEGQYSVFGVFCVEDSKAELTGLNKYQHGHFIDNFPTEAEAIEAWNTRANNRTKRTCKMEEAYCSECGRPDPSSGDARFCAYCGAKVVK